MSWTVSAGALGTQVLQLVLLNCIQRRLVIVSDICRLWAETGIQVSMAFTQASQEHVTSEVMSHEHNRHSGEHY